MKSTKEMQTSNAEMVTISRAEYEEFQGTVAKREFCSSPLLSSVAVFCCV